MKRTGFRVIKEFQKDEHCVSMLEYKGELIIATTKHIYKVIEGKLHKIEIVKENEKTLHNI